jgi:hypothetical protein
MRGRSTITVRTDAAVEAALLVLTADGRSRSEAARQAVLEAARAHLRADLYEEARALSFDPVDREEARAVQSFMQALRA